MGEKDVKYGRRQVNRLNEEEHKQVDNNNDSANDEENGGGNPRTVISTLTIINK